MKKRKLVVLSSAALALGLGFLLTSAVRPARAATTHFREYPFEIADIHWEYNSSANDLGVHVTLDGEDWKSLTIENPAEKTIFQVKGGGPYRTLGMTELFFEGAEPALDEFPLQDLLDLFPEGPYEFSGVTVDGLELESTDFFTHAIPDGPVVRTQVGAGNLLRISWNEVTAPPPGFPNEAIHIKGYEVIVEPSFDVTLPATARSVTVSPEFVQSLGSGVNHFEVLAIEESGNQTITEGTFRL
jgi:hypothetical protein